ncbi:glycosyltransferase family 4 protein [Motiliproteus sp. SC1-56]|uniref:glycosyltransferase family 4 protein n=1 Tax=Motiliproteus sp. SC1-56 TaxID=2799565 RepID=UPI001A8E47ED|nr:glycosyltransferase family 4 protein [Motiliproteus sp. SC1-56]
MSPIPLAFYAPLKPPTHPNPSGDRTLAQLLMQALALAGFEVMLASRFRSRDGSGNPHRQQRLRRLGERLAQRLIRRLDALPAEHRPRLWLTYHLYHKAPDWLGPTVCRTLGIPYVVVEASYAPKQQTGPWRLGLEASLGALHQADAVLCFNPVDRACLAERLPPRRLHALPPFLDLAPPPSPHPSRAQLAERWGIDPRPPWLIAVAMMRPGDKAHSYRLLAEALKLLPGDLPWQLLIAGDGRAAAQVRADFAALEDRVRFLGLQPPEALQPLLAAADLCVWPAVNEAFGMALLEAQAQGTAVLAGDEGGVKTVLAPECQGWLTPPRDPVAFAAALARLLASPEELARLGKKAQAYVETHHGLPATAGRLQALLTPLL